MGCAISKIINKVV